MRKMSKMYKDNIDFVHGFFFSRSKLGTCHISTHWNQQSIVSPLSSKPFFICWLSRGNLMNWREATLDEMTQWWSGRDGSLFVFFRWVHRLDKPPLWKTIEGVSAPNLFPTLFSSTKLALNNHPLRLLTYSWLCFSSLVCDYSVWISSPMLT